MFPAFFIGGVPFEEGVIQMFQSDGVGVSSNTFSAQFVDYPVRAGDLLLAVFAPYNPGTNLTIDGSAWIPLYEEYSSSVSISNENGDVANNAGTVIGAYYFAASDGDSPLFTLTGVNNNFSENGFIARIRGVNPLRPFLQVNALNRAASQLTISGSSLYPPPLGPISPNSRVLTIVHGYNNLSEYGPLDGAQTHFTPIAVDSVDTYLTGQHRQMFVALTDETGSTSENLFPYGAGHMAGGNWTMVNFTPTDQTPAGHDTGGPFKQTSIAVTANTGRHESHRDVDLVAGQEYTFWAHVRDATGSADRRFYFTVDDLLGNERGTLMRLYTQQDNQYTIGAGFSEVTSWQVGSYGSYQQWRVQCRFTAAISGTHRFRVGLSTSPTDMSSTTTAVTIAIDGLGLARGWVAPPYLPALVPNGAAVTGLAMPPNHMVKGCFPSSTFAIQRIEFNMATCTPQDQTLLPTLHESALATTFKSLLGPGPSNSGEVSGKSSGTVSPYDNGGGGKRYYFEVLVDFMESASARSGIGFMPAFESRDTITTSTSFAENFYAWRNAGNFYECSELLGNSGATFATGDVIGAEVDFSDYSITFYKNGVAVTDMYGMNILPRHQGLPLRAWVWAMTTPGDLRQFTARFKSSEMQYLPSGALPWDWQNS